MVKRPRYPSPVEHTGYYNVPPKEDFPDPDYFHCSVKNVPPFDWDEFEQLRTAAKECLKKESARLPPVPKEYLGGDGWFVDDTEDRTLPVLIEDLRLLTPSLIRCLQRHGLSRQPLWRIHLYGEWLDTAVCVYPSVVRVGDLDRSRPLQEALETVIGRMRGQREARDGPMVRQIAYLCRIVPTIVGRVGKRSVDVAGIFDTGFQASRKEITVWLLHSGEGPLSYDVTRPPADSSQSLRVRADGVCEELRVEDPVQLRKGERWCRAWHVPRGTERIVVVGPSEAGRKQGRYTFRINPEEVIKDRDLKRADADTQ